MCGESALNEANRPKVIGSPPHVWGKPIGYNGRWLFFRITPTCVGKALPPAQGLTDDWDHPHMCGESIVDGMTAREQPGSPPHVWGKLGFNLIDYRAFGITPTCVGKAPEPVSWMSSIRDHPHMCGESHWRSL